MRRLWQTLSRSQRVTAGTCGGRVSTFGRWQVDGHFQTAPSSTETRLSFSDYRNGCHTERHALRNKRWIPNFSDGQLRLILLTRAWLYLAQHKPFPENADWKTLNETATKKAVGGLRH